MIELRGRSIRAGSARCGAAGFVFSGPVSRILSSPKGVATISLGAALPRRSSSQPGSDSGPGRTFSPIRPCSGWGLPGRPVSGAPVRSYRTISPLPAKAGGMFLWHFPSAYAARGLPGTLPYGVRTFLDRGFPASRPPGPLNEESVALTEYCWADGPHDIVSHMKTTIEVSEALMEEAKRFAAKRGDHAACADRIQPETRAG